MNMGKKKKKKKTLDEASWIATNWTRSIILERNQERNRFPTPTRSIESITIKWSIESNAFLRSE